MHRFASRTLATVAVILCLAVLGPPGSALAQGGTPASSFSHRIAQGEFFLESGLVEQALREFRAAAAMPEAREHSEVFVLLARTEYRAGDLSAAVDAIRSAHALDGAARDPEVTELHEFLTTRFGKVLVIGAGTDGAVMPVPAVAILDPEVKRIFELAVERLE